MSVTQALHLARYLVEQTTLWVWSIETLRKERRGTRHFNEGDNTCLGSGNMFAHLCYQLPLPKHQLKLGCLNINLN